MKPRNSVDIEDGNVHEIYIVTPPYLYAPPQNLFLEGGRREGAQRRKFKQKKHVYI